MGSVAVGPKEESLFLGLWRRGTFIRSLPAKDGTWKEGSKEGEDGE